jgi:hypothetical protein
MGNCAPALPGAAGRVSQHQLGCRRQQNSEHITTAGERLLLKMLTNLAGTESLRALEDRWDANSAHTVENGP